MIRRCAGAAGHSGAVGRPRRVAPLRRRPAKPRRRLRPRRVALVQGGRDSDAKARGGQAAADAARRGGAARGAARALPRVEGAVARGGARAVSRRSAICRGARPARRAALGKRAGCEGARLARPERRPWPERGQGVGRARHGKGDGVATAPALRTPTHPPLPSPLTPFSVPSLLVLHPAHGLRRRAGTPRTRRSSAWRARAAPRRSAGCPSSHARSARSPAPSVRRPIDPIHG